MFFLNEVVYFFKLTCGCLLINYFNISCVEFIMILFSDLPGFTRSVYKSNHALISPESHVYGPLPDWYS